MKIKVPFFASGEEIIRIAKEKQGKHKKVAFAQWPDGSLRIILNGTVGDEEDFNEV